MGYRAKGLLGRIIFASSVKRLKNQTNFLFMGGKKGRTAGKITFSTLTVKNVCLI
jgi:hypothetical protein